MSGKELLPQDENTFLGRIFVCAGEERDISFQLVDEYGDGSAYAGLDFVLHDQYGNACAGVTDNDGNGRIYGFAVGEVVLTVDTTYKAENDLYHYLINRSPYPLYITDLQVRAEKTQFRNKDGSRTPHNPANLTANNMFFIQAEVSELVRINCHLPTPQPRERAHMPATVREADEQGNVTQYGIRLKSCARNIIEIRPLRALRPVLSLSPEFSLLNAYQLSLMANLSYSSFGQLLSPDKRSVSFPADTSIADFFHNRLGEYKESWQLTRQQTDKFYPLLEDVPYSERMEIYPYSPSVYPDRNDPAAEKYENPELIHFFTYTDTDSATNPGVEAFVIGYDIDNLLIAIRGVDFSLTDYAILNDFELAEYNAHDHTRVHKGFFDAYRALSIFINGYISEFFLGKKIIISGHNLGGAIGLLLAAALKQNRYEVTLYTYGAPRVGNRSFVEAIDGLNHHRIVHNLDPIPSLPPTWFDYKPIIKDASRAFGLMGKAQAKLEPLVKRFKFFFFYLMYVNHGDDRFQHQGKLRHIMSIELGEEQATKVLWEPDKYLELAKDENVDTDHGGGQAWVRQAFSLGDHRIVEGYMSGCWTALRRALGAEHGTPYAPVLSKGEFSLLEGGLQQAMFEHEQVYRRPAFSRGARLRRSVEGLQAEFVLESYNVWIKQLEFLTNISYSDTEIFGDAATSPGLGEAKDRWFAHSENQAPVYLAYAPTPPEDKDPFAEIIGLKNEPLDIDSIS